MRDFIRKYGWHMGALILFLGIVVIYFSPSVIDGKVMRQGDSIRFAGMVQELVEYYEEEGESSEWLGSMFSGMPSYQVGIPRDEFNPLIKLMQLPKGIDSMGAGIILLALIAFYILMCVMGVNRWLALLGAIAYALASYNFIIIHAGHISKAYAIAHMPLTIAGMVLLFKDKTLWGSVLFVLGVAFSILEGHLQITYYLALFCVFVYLGYFYQKIKEKDYKKLLKTTGILVVAALLAILPNLSNLYSNYEMSKTSLRGPSELTQPETGEVVSTGMDKEYAFAFSYGKGELATLLIPDVYGRASGTTLDSSSETYQFLRKNGYQVGKDVMMPTYWGSKPFTEGGVYLGALICFLFLLGMFVIKNPMKWWLFAGAVFFILLSLGKNLAWFNNFMFDYLPMYNKFRTPEMALVIPGLVFPIIACWGVKEILENKVELKPLKAGLIWSLAIAGGICLVIWLLPNAFLNFQSPADAQYSAQPWYNALLADRASMASSDAFRSLLFILLGAGLLFLQIKAKDKKRVSVIVCAGLAILTLVDLWGVDRRYLNDDNYINESLAETFKPTAADQEIFKDKDPAFRVANLSNTFEETSSSYFHRSIGGYHAAKLRRYQELITYRLSGELNQVVKALQSAQSEQDMVAAFSNTPSLNMLNTRYVIYNPQYPPIRNPYANGDAWFVSEVDIVENADAEMAALQTIDPKVTAVVDKRFAGDLTGFTPQQDTTATIKLNSYRPNRLSYTSDAATEQLALFSEIYYQPGWEATIDGNPAPHFRADWTLRAMRIPAGKHEIEFVFHPHAYRTASKIALFSSYLIVFLLVAAIGYSAWNSRKRKVQA
ncbi:YfhO family protein [Parabacteroides sp. OttesenSCG-928-K15]|nr:YfhO family protein [Parabacteroides sp. OttesenSCG-928-K15]